MIRIIIILFASFILSGCGAKYYLDKGQKEFHEQNYHQAFADTLSAANYGNVEAQYATGYMYYYGIGTDKNDYLAQSWFAKAAAVGEPKSIEALKQVNKTAPNPLLFGMDKTQVAPNPPKPSRAQVHANAPAKEHMMAVYPKTTTQPAPKPAHKNPHAKYKTSPKKPPPATLRLPAIPAPHTTYVK